MSPDPALAGRLARHGQEHLLRWWHKLDNAQRSELAAEVSSIDFDRLASLVARFVGDQERDETPAPDRVRPIDVVRLPQTDAERVADRRVAEDGAAALAA